MPEIFGHVEIVVRFYANEYEPIHVDAQYAEAELNVEFGVVDKEIIAIIYKRVAVNDDFPLYNGDFTQQLAQLT